MSQSFKLFSAAFVREGENEKDSVLKIQIEISKTKSKMKKTILMLAVALFSTAAMAQGERRSGEDRAKMRAEMVKNQAERLAKDFELKDDAKTAFVDLYTQYQNELMAPMGERQRGENAEERGERKKLSEMSDEEITNRIQGAFARQEKAIEAMQKRLEVQKKYYAEFGKTLKPQQLMKIFGQQRPQQGGRDAQRGQRDGGRGNFGGGRGGFGGPGGFGGGF